MVLMWSPMIALGHVLYRLLFEQDSPWSTVFFLAWPVVNFYLAYKLCQKKGEIVVARLVSFFFVELAVTLIVLLYFG